MASLESRTAARRILHRERRGLFRLWVVALGVVFAAVLLATPLVHSAELPAAAVAVIVPPIEIALIIAAALWLLRLTMTARDRRRGGAPR